MSSSSSQLTLEDILLKEGVLKQDQVNVIKLESINSGKAVEKIILEHQFASPEKIAQARSVILGVPFVSLTGRAISAEALNLIPEAVARRYTLIPFERDGESISVAMADP